MRQIKLRYLTNSVAFEKSKATTNSFGKSFSLKEYIASVIAGDDVPSYILPLNVFDTSYSKEIGFYKSPKIDLWDYVAYMKDGPDCPVLHNRNIYKDVYIPFTILVPYVTNIKVFNLNEDIIMVKNKGVYLDSLIRYIYNRLPCNAVTVTIPIYENGATTTSPTFFSYERITGSFYNTEEELVQGFQDYLDSYFPDVFEPTYSNGVFTITFSPADQDSWDSLNITALYNDPCALSIQIDGSSTTRADTLVSATTLPYIITEYSGNIVQTFPISNSVILNNTVSNNDTVKYYAPTSNAFTQVTVLTGATALDISRLNNLISLTATSRGLTSIINPTTSATTLYNVQGNSLTTLNTSTITMLNGTFNVADNINLTTYTSLLGSVSALYVNNTSISNVKLDTFTTTTNADIFAYNMRVNYTVTPGSGGLRGFYSYNSSATGKMTGALDLSTYTLSNAIIETYNNLYSSLTLGSGTLTRYYGYSNNTVTSNNYGSVVLSNADLRSYSCSLLTTCSFTGTTGTISRIDYNTCKITGTQTFGSTTFATNAYVYFGYNSLMTGITLTSGALNYFNVRNCNLSSVDMSTVTTTGNATVYILNNTNLSTFIQPSSSSSVSYFAGNSTILTSLDLSNFVFTGNDSFLQISSSRISTLVHPTGNLNFYDLSGNRISNFPTITWTWVGSNIRFALGTQVASNGTSDANLVVNHSTQNNTFRYYYMEYATINYFTVANHTFTTNCDVKIGSNKLTAAESNQWAVLIDSKLPSGGTGTVNLRYRLIVDGEINAPIDSSSGGYNGIAAKDSMLAKGYTVIF